MTDIAKAVELARETIAAIESIPTGFIIRVEERLLKVSRALLAVAPVVEAAQAWRRERVPLDDAGRRLADAVDALRGAKP